MQLLCALICLVSLTMAETLEKSAPYYEAPPVHSIEPTSRILEMVHEHNGQQGYNFRFSSEDGIARDETASYDSPVSGSYSYTSPEGTEVLIKYVADENGFRAEGLALPTAVPTEYPTPSVPYTEPPKEYRSYRSQKESAATQDTTSTRNSPPSYETRNTRISPLGYSQPDTRAVETGYVSPDVRTATPSYQASEVRSNEPAYAAVDTPVAKSTYSGPEFRLNEQTYSAPEVRNINSVYAVPEERTVSEKFSVPETPTAPETRKLSSDYPQTRIIPELRLVPVEYAETRAVAEEKPQFFRRTFKNFRSKYN